MRRGIERDLPEAEFDRVMVLSLGPGTLHTLSWFMGWTPDADVQMASGYLLDVSRIQVGVYEVRRMGDLGDRDLASLSRLKNDGWDLAVKVRDEDEQVWLYSRERHGQIRDMLVLTLDQENMVVVRLQGRLSRLFQRAMEDHDVLREIGQGRL